MPAALGSFAAWLRELPLKPGRPDVLLFDGRRKANQSAQFAVLDVDVGTRDLQQCADAVIRLRAEYLRASGQEDRITFEFTSGDDARWTDWKTGVRPTVTGKRVEWKRSAAPDASDRSFRAYLDLVFTYAGSLSLAREVAPLAATAPVEPGDVFIQGGSPGHAVLVVDVAANDRGERVLLLAQSYMPAQDIHILVDPADSRLSPWYEDRRGEPLRTPEWTFPAGSITRFPAP